MRENICGNNPERHKEAIEIIFGNGTGKRKVFCERIGMTPAQYRAQFGGGE